MPHISLRIQELINAVSELKFQEVKSQTTRQIIIIQFNPGSLEVKLFSSFQLNRF